MKTLIEKQILEWKEELARQKTTKEQAEKVLEQTIKTIDMIEGGIQAQEMLLKKIEQESQPTDIEGQGQVSEPKSSKIKGQPA
tara:strand:- start:78 stop:326 length:249 start_codon:yes stop_codon:yes gene_type:complete